LSKRRLIVNKKSITRNIKKTKNLGKTLKQKDLKVIIELVRRVVEFKKLQKELRQAGKKPKT